MNTSNLPDNQTDGTTNAQHNQQLPAASIPQQGEADNLSANDKIELNFINQSDDKNNSEVKIFQQNVANDFNDIEVA